jgi:hypothetical protein
MSIGDESGDSWEPREEVLEAAVIRLATLVGAEGEGTAMALQALRPEQAVPATPTQKAENLLQPERWEAYLARRAKGIRDLQPWRQEQALELETASGAVRAVLVDLAPAANAWFLLSLEAADGEHLGTWHLENRDPDGTRLSLDAAWPEGLTLWRGGELARCALWSGPAPSPLEQARLAGRPYEDLCEGRVALRNPAEGHKTRLEWAADFLRDRVPAGEQITVFVRDKILADAHRITPETSRAQEPAILTRPPPPGAPTPLRMAAGSRDVLLVPVDLGLPIHGLHEQRALGGAWYSVTGHDGVYLAALQPGLLATAEDTPWEDRLDPLDAYERDALVYLVAFDLARFDLHYELGTDHPRLGWSDRVPPEVVEAGLGGPDGVAEAAPLVVTGKVDPKVFPRLEASFTGGFKRDHGAFGTGTLAHVNQGSHYGFMEQGVILSRLQPGLATLSVDVDGHVDLHTWRAADDGDLPMLRDARQNGLPLVEPDPATGVSAPGQKVTAWAEGNWSGSVDGRLRSMRAGLCLQESQGERTLIYGWFTSATPSAMARVFMAAGCRDAMMMDMNALEHTYLALYRDQDGFPLPEHLSTGMDVLDKLQGDTVLPRFAAFSDNRDFFYLLRRSDP